MEHSTPDDYAVRELFEYQRKLATSHDPAERFRTLWIGTLLGELLEQCSNGQIGDLLSMVQDSLGIFGPEFAVVEHSKRRLHQTPYEIRKKNWELVRDAGSELLNAEAALFRAGIPHLLLPFQRDRFLSNVFYMPSARQGRRCLLHAGFRSVPQSEAVLLDFETNRVIRLVEVANEKVETA